MIPGSANPLLLAAADGGYAIERSLRFNSADSAYLSRTPASAGNRKTWTWAGWVKICNSTVFKHIFVAGTGVICRFGEANGSHLIHFSSFNGSTFDWILQTSAVYRDVSAWMHLMFVVDTTQATSTNRIKLYVNGEQVTSFSTAAYPNQNTDWSVNNTVAHYIGGYGASFFGDFYLADIHFIDGQALTPTSFTETDANGVLQPKAFAGSYGSQGWHLDFADNSAATATTLGKDTSGNGKNWTPNNLSVTAGAGNDSLVDVPTNGAQTDTGAGGEVRGNYATFNPTESSTSGTKTLTNGNLDVLLADANAARLTIPPIQASGKYQWEITIGSKTAQYYQMGLNLLSMVYAAGDLHTTFRSDGIRSNTLSGSWSGIGVSYTSGDIITVTYDNATNACAFYKNGVYSATFTLSGSPQSSLNFGVFYGGPGNTNYTLNAGQRAFAHPVSGFKALNTANLPAGTITTSGSFTGNANADGPFTWLNGVPTAMTINGNAVTFGTHADKLANGFKVRSSSGSYNTAGSNTYSITTTGAKFKDARAQPNP